MEEIEFKQTLPVQIRFNDIDVFRHLNNSVYFSFYNLGKTTYFNTIKKQNPGIEEIGAVIANINVDFLCPVFANEPVAVQTAVTEIGNKSFKIIQQLINAETEEVKCVYRTIMVEFDIETGKSQEIPESWKEAIFALEGRNVVATPKE
ncbi:MAG: acyl-CoA thioesterase [Bacteroides sp.]|nr:acyl-CoA thioesterase [Bacteroides sp.]